MRSEPIQKSKTPSANSTRGISLSSSENSIGKQGFEAKLTGGAASGYPSEAPNSLAAKTGEGCGPDGIRTRTFELGRLICCHYPRARGLSPAGLLEEYSHADSSSGTS